MNILPFVLSFLLLLAITGGAILHQTTGIAKEQRAIHGYLAALRSVRSEQDRQKYNKDQKSDERWPRQKEAKTSSKKRKEKDYESPRDSKDRRDVCKFPLSKEAALYPYAEKLLKLLYRPPVFKEGVHREILDALIDSKGATFLDRFPKDGKIVDAYYKMVKGTNIYDAEKGYPPLDDFFSLEQGKGKISFYYASREVLTAVLGESLTQKVIDAEETYWRKTGKKARLGKQTLIDLVGQDFPVQAISEVFYFTPPTIGTTSVMTDEDTGITARR